MQHSKWTSRTRLMNLRPFRKASFSMAEMYNEQA
jgi:hypothetical protein